MKSIFKFALLSLLFSLTFSCFQDDDDTATGTHRYQKFCLESDEFRLSLQR